MVGVALLAATRAYGSPPSSKWPETISGWSLPGRFAFFVFKVSLGYCEENYFPGLQTELVEGGYIVAGTLDQWDRACYASLSSNGVPHDHHEIYRRVYETLTNMGYTLTGERTTTAKRFKLR